MGLPTYGLCVRLSTLQAKSNSTYIKTFTYNVYVYYNQNVKNQAIKIRPMPSAGVPPKSRREEYADATRQALISAAGELFASQGYQQVGIEAIARSARVTRGAFYHHFADKAELFDALVGALQEQAAAKVQAAAGAAPKRSALARAFASFWKSVASPLIGNS